MPGETIHVRRSRRRRRPRSVPPGVAGTRTTPAREPTGGTGRGRSARAPGESLRGPVFEAKPRISRVATASGPGASARSRRPPSRIRRLAVPSRAAALPAGYRRPRPIAAGPGPNTPIRSPVAPAAPPPIPGTAIQRREVTRRTNSPDPGRIRPRSPPAGMPARPRRTAAQSRGSTSASTAVRESAGRGVRDGSSCIPAGSVGIVYRSRVEPCSSVPRGSSRDSTVGRPGLGDDQGDADPHGLVGRSRSRTATGSGPTGRNGPSSVTRSTLTADPRRWRPRHPGAAVRPRPGPRDSRYRSASRPSGARRSSGPTG